MKTRTLKRTDRRARAGITRAAQAAYIEADTLPVAGANDSRYFPRIEAALYITDPATRRGVHLDRAEEALLFRALAECADRGNLQAASLTVRLDPL